MEDNYKLLVTPGPHIRGRVSTPGIMRDVLIALLPAAISGIYFFGLKAAVVIISSIASAVICEAVIQRLTNRPVTVNDFSAAVTGMLIGLILPPACPWWVAVVASCVAVGIAKAFYGGLGHNIFNPALVGRAFVSVAWPAALATAYFWPSSAQAWTAGFDAMTTATPLALAKMGELTSSGLSQFYSPLFFGNVAGSIGEASAIALHIGAAYLLIKGHINHRKPLSYISTVLVISWLYGYDPVFHILSGGLILGAFFMATDYVTSPITPIGGVIFGVGCGLLTALIRIFGGYPEGVNYSILIMNAMVPMIDRLTRSRIFGEVRRSV